MELIQVILMEPDKVQSDLYSINLSSNTGVEVIPTETIPDVINFLGLLPDVKLVILKNTGEAGNDSPLSLIDHIEKNKLKSKVLVYGGKLATTAAFAKVVPEKITPEQMVVLTKSELNITQSLSAEALDSGYFPFSIEYFRNIPTTPVEVFVQVGQGESMKFIKRFNKDGAIEPDFVEKYKAKGLKWLHVRKEERGIFTMKVSQIMLGKLREADSDLVSDGDSVNSVHQIVFEQLTQVNEEMDAKLEDVGFKQEEVKLANEAISSVLKALEKSSSLVGTLTKIYQTYATFSYRHSYMSSIVTFNILKQFSWASKAHFEAMMFTCFFHDIVLDKDDLLSVDNEAALKAGPWDDKDKDKTMKHALLACNYVTMKKNFPGEADIIIKHHHGSETGIGFPTHISEKINRLAQIFMVAEAFVMQVITSDNKNIDVLQVIKNVSSKYEGPNIPVVIEALKKALIAGQ